MVAKRIRECGKITMTLDKKAKKEKRRMWVKIIYLIIEGMSVIKFGRAPNRIGTRIHILLPTTQSGRY